MTFIEEQRRKQIVAAAVKTIAEQGYGQTSLAEIARELEISKGVIAYHFDGKQELIGAIINTILREQYAHIRSRVSAEPSAAGRLRAYIAASFEFMQSHRNYCVALVDLWGSFSSAEDKRAFSATAYDPCRAHLASILAGGQAAGEFTEFDPHLLAALVQATIDGLMLQWVFDPDQVDLACCAAETTALYLGRAT